MLGDLLENIKSYNVAVVGFLKGKRKRIEEKNVLKIIGKNSPNLEKDYL